MRRSLLFSCALHAALVLIALATGPRRAAREAARAVEIAFDAPAPPSATVARVQLAI